MNTQYVNNQHDHFVSDHLPPPCAWPELDLTHFRYPSSLNCAQELLKSVASNPSKIAFFSATVRLSYQQLECQVNQVSHVLRDQMHLVPGNRVLLRGVNHPMLVVCLLAVWQIGCVAVPSMPLLRAKELGMMLEQAQVSAALCSFDLKDELLQAQGQHPILQKIFYYGHPHPTSLEARMAQQSTEFFASKTCAEDVCLIAYTSGTTGKPKATTHFHRDILAVCDSFPVSILRSGADDIFIGTSPFAFTYGLGAMVLFPLRVGASAVLLEKNNPVALLEAIQQHQATICFGVPTLYRQMLPLLAQFDFSSVRKAVSAGEMLPVATRMAWHQATGLQLIDGIGTTEMLHIFIAAADEQVRPGATGKPIPGYQACVLDESGNTVAPGVVGRLAVKGPTGCRYLKDERQSQYVSNGWNVTGDAYEMDSDGYFWYRARIDDMIISAGYNIAAPEVEEVLLQHPAVAECAVIGVEDEERGQIVKAFIVLRANLVGDEQLIVALQAYVKQMIAPYKYPRVIEFSERLPRTANGKLQKFRLHEECMQLSTTRPLKAEGG